MPEIEERPPYYAMVYIVSQLKNINAPMLMHIGVQENNKTWIPLCQTGRQKPSRCEYEYKTTLDRITCKSCVRMARVNETSTAIEKEMTMSDAPVTDRVEIFRGIDAQFRWRRIATNNQLVSGSEEGFTSKSWAERSAHTYNSDVPADNFIDKT